MKYVFEGQLSLAVLLLAVLVSKGAKTTVGTFPETSPITNVMLKEGASDGAAVTDAPTGGGGGRGGTTSEVGSTKTQRPNKPSTTASASGGGGGKGTTSEMGSTKSQGPSKPGGNKKTTTSGGKSTTKASGGGSGPGGGSTSGEGSTTTTRQPLKGDACRVVISLPLLLLSVLM